MDIGADLCTGLHRNQHDNRVYFHEIWHSDADRFDCDDAGSGWADMILTDGATIYGLPESIKFLGQNYILGIPWQLSCLPCWP